MWTLLSCVPHHPAFPLHRYMYHVLTKNTTVTDHNRNLLVETIRSITEILIWGDQNDSSVFEYVFYTFFPPARVVRFVYISRSLSFQLLFGEEHVCVFPQHPAAEVGPVRLCAAPADAQHPVREHKPRDVSL